MHDFQFKFYAHLVNDQTKPLKYACNNNLGLCCNTNLNHINN